MKKIIVAIIVLSLNSPLISQTKSWYFLVDAVSNNYHESIFSSSSLEVGYRPKGFPLIFGIGIGVADFGNFTEYSAQFINIDVDYRYVLFQKKITRFKPFIGIKASYYFLGEIETPSNQYGFVNYSYLKNLVTVGPTLGFDYYLGNVGAINFMFSPQYELSSGFVNRFSLGLSRTL